MTNTTGQLPTQNYLLPISNNLWQTEDENSVVGVELSYKPTSVPPADSWLPADGLTESQPESLPNLLSKQHEPVNHPIPGKW